MIKTCNLVIILILMILFSMGFKCNKRSLEVIHHFNEKMDINPILPTYRVGDTIWITYNNPNKKMLDSKSNRVIDVDSAWITFQVSLNSIYNAPVTPGVRFCDFVTVHGVNVNTHIGESSTSMINSFGCTANNNLEISVGIVLKTTGIYAIDHSSDRPIHSCNNVRNGLPYSIVEFTWNVTNNNKDIFLSLPNALRRQAYLDRIDKKQAFIIKVEI